MIHDPEIEVTCDSDGCNNSVSIPLDWSVGGYDIKDDRLKEKLDSDHDWGTKGDKHFCEDHRGR